MGKYDYLYDDGQDKQRAGLNLQSGVSVQPDAAARNLELSKRYGLPVSLIESQRPEFDARSKIDDGMATLEQSPKLRSFIAADPEISKVTHDDLESMGAMEKAARYITSADSAPRGGLLNDLMQGTRAVASAAPQVSSGLYGVAAAPFELLGIDSVGGFLRDQQKSAQGVASNVMGTPKDAGFVENSVMSGLQSFGQNLILMPVGLAKTAYISSEAAMLGLMGVITGGQSYGKARDAGVSPAQSIAYGIQDATAEVVTEKYLGMAGFLKNVKAGASAGKLAVFELSKEMPGEMAATLWQNFNEWTNVNPDKTVGQFLSEQPAALAETAIATLVGGSAQIGTVKAAEKLMGIDQKREQQARVAEQHFESLVNLSKTIEASKLLERSPDTLRSYAQSLVDGGFENVHVDSAKLVEAGVNLQELAQAIPSVASQLNQVETGGDLVIPTAELLVNSIGQTFQQSLIDNARTDVNGMSRIEAQEFMAEKGDKINADIEKVLSEQADNQTFQASKQVVQDSMLANLNEMGRFQPSVNNHIAGLFATHAAVMGARTGMTPEQFAAKYPLRFADQKSASGGYDQNGNLKTETPEFKNWFGDSKVVDSEGKPLVVYHGTRREFTTFDYSRIGEQGRAEGAGFYFTNSEKVASGYGAPMEVFLSINKPLAYNAKPFSGSDIQKIVARVAELEAQDEGGDIADGFLANFGDVRSDGIKRVIKSAADLIAADETALDQLSGIVGSGVRPQFVNQATRDVTGFDGVVADGFSDSGDTDNRIYVAFFPEQIKSVKNRGTYDPNDANILNQEARGNIAFADDITQQASVISLMEKADLSTFIHEGGHFFLEVQSDLAIRIAQRIAAGEEVSDGERSILEDMNTTLGWMGVTGDENITGLDKWSMMTIEEKRPHHETFARGFEAYAFEGKSPSMALSKMFQTFRAWLTNVYKQLLKSSNASKTDIGDGLDVKLSDEVRAVMDRMLATNEEIESAEAARSMGPMFASLEASGMDLEAFKMYHDMGMQATLDAQNILSAKGLRDMQWLRNARSRKLKELQRQNDDKRLLMAREVRAEVYSKPVYQAWQFLTGKSGEKVKGKKAPGKSKTVNPETDNLFEAIAKLGGLDRAEVQRLYGIDEKEKLESGVFGMPVVRKTGGVSVDVMGQRLIEEGYLLPDENGTFYPEKFEELFEDQRRGTDRYSIKRDMAQAYGDAPIETLDTQELANGKLSTDELKRRYGVADDALWRKLSGLKMTSNDGGFDPDVIAEKFGFGSGDEMVRSLVEAEDPKTVIANMVDMRMLEQYGDLSTPAGLERAADAAIHNEMRVKFAATELRVLQHAISVREGQPGTKSTVDVIAQAAKEYAEKLIANLKIGEIRPTQYSVAAARSGRLAQKSLPDIDEAAKHKRNQVINMAASKAASDAKAEIEKINLFFRKIVSGKDASIAKSRDMDMVNAARAMLANFGYGGKAKSAGEYLESVKTYNPALYEVLRQSTDAAAAMAKPFNQLTFEELKGLRDEVESMWHLSKRSKVMEIDGNLLDRAEVAEKLVERMVEIGIPDSMPGDTSAVTEQEQRVMNISSVWATMQRVESWVDLKDGSNKMGAFRRYLWTPIKEAADKYRAAKLVHLRGFRAAFDEIAGTMKKGDIHSPELGYTFGKESGGVALNEILHAIIHTGNESNMRKLLVGRGWATLNEDGSLDTRRWDMFIQRLAKEGVLTKAHFDFAQKVWDLLETTKPMAQEAHRDAYGKYFEEITANPVHTPFGVYRGGYAPAMVDSRVVKDMELKKLIEEGKDGMAYAFPSTSKGFTKGRVEYNKPLLLDLRTLPQHIDKVLLFSHMENPLRDAAKLMGMAEVSTPLNKQNPSFINGVLTPWLTRAARQQVTTPVVGAGYTMRFLNTLRNRSSMAAMFANVSNTAQQVSGFLMAGVKVKPSNLASATAQYMKSPKKMAENVSALSVFMNNRMSNEVDAMMGEIESILIDPSVYESAQAWTKRHTYFMQSAVDNVMGPIIWTGAFNQAIEEKYEHEDAVRIADSVVRQTQGSTLPEDVSRIETGPAYARILTQFYGYFNMQANLVGTELGKVTQEMGLRKGMGKGLFIFMMAVYAPALVAEAVAQLFKGGPGDEDKDGEWLDDWLMSLFVTGPMRNVTALVPFIGSAVNSAIARFNSNPTDDKMGMSAAVGMIESSAGVPYDLYKSAIGEGNAQRTVRDVATLISITTGLPASAAARPIGWLAGVAQGKTEPTSPVDAVRGLVTGTASADSKQK